MIVNYQGVSLYLCMLWLHSGGVAKIGITGTVGTKDWPRNRRGESQPATACKD